MNGESSEGSGDAAVRIRIEVGDQLTIEDQGDGWFQELPSPAPMRVRARVRRQDPDGKLVEPLDMQTVHLVLAHGDRHYLLLEPRAEHWVRSPGGVVASYSLPLYSVAPGRHVPASEFAQDDLELDRLGGIKAAKVTVLGSAVDD